MKQAKFLWGRRVPRPNWWPAPRDAAPPVVKWLNPAGKALRFLVAMCRQGGRQTGRHGGDWSDGTAWHRQTKRWLRRERTSEGSERSTEIKRPTYARILVPVKRNTWEGGGWRAGSRILTYACTYRGRFCFGLVFLPHFSPSFLLRSLMSFAPPPTLPPSPSRLLPRAVTCL